MVDMVDGMGWDGMGWAGLGWAGMDGEACGVWLVVCGSCWRSPHMQTNGSMQGKKGRYQNVFLRGIVLHIGVVPHRTNHWQIQSRLVPFFVEFRGPLLLTLVKLGHNG